MLRGGAQSRVFSWTLESKSSLEEMGLFEFLVYNSTLSIITIIISPRKLRHSPTTSSILL